MWLAPDEIGELKVTGGLQNVIRSAAAPAPGLNRALSAPCFQRVEKAYQRGPAASGVLDPFMSKRAFGRPHPDPGVQSRARRGPQDAAAPFDGDLQRLAEILGALHYLRGICGTNEGRNGATEMQALIDAETPSGDRRTRMIAGFNRGYNGFQQTYRTCTPAANVAIRRYIRGRREDFAGSDRALRQLKRSMKTRFPSCFLRTSAAGLKLSPAVNLS